MRVGRLLLLLTTEDNRRKSTSVVETRNLLHLGQLFHVRWVEEGRWKERNETCQVSGYDEDVVGERLVDPSLRNPRLGGADLRCSLARSIVIQLILRQLRPFARPTRSF
jgi:hypothetical protein